MNVREMAFEACKPRIFDAVVVRASQGAQSPQPQPEQRSRCYFVLGCTLPDLAVAKHTARTWKNM